MIWVNTLTGQHGHLNYAGYDAGIDVTVILIVYFGEGYSVDEWFPVDEFFELHQPTRMDS